MQTDKSENLVQDSDNSNKEILPTGKPHVSFSEIKLWSECSYRHFLTHVKKVAQDSQSPILAFGTAVHAALEKFLITRTMKPEICFEKLDQEWTKHKDHKDFTEEALAKCKDDALKILLEVPSFFDREFPEWETVDAEHQLYESIEGHPHYFKGFIDGIIKSKGKRGETVYWILDHKTSNRGWFREKRSDDMVKSQLAFYKNYWHQKHPDIPFKDIRCGFIILKKVAKLGEHCELFTVPLGDVPIKRSLKVMSNMLTSVKKGISLKNRDACTWCEFKNTSHCP